MRLGLLTSGGDCAGLNAVIRAVVTRAVLGHGWQVLGIRQATHGLLSRPVDALELTPDRRRRRAAPRRHAARHDQSRQSRSPILPRTATGPTAPRWSPPATTSSASTR